MKWETPLFFKFSALEPTLIRTSKLVVWVSFWGTVTSLTWLGNFIFLYIIYEYY